MSAHTISAALTGGVLTGANKRVRATLTLSASYDAGGSVLDLSTASSLGATNGFATVAGLTVLACPVAGVAYELFYLPGTGANDGKVYVRTASTDPPAEASGDLHLITYVVEIVGT